MATLKKELREILDRYGIDPRDKSQLWDCHGTLVLYHRAYEIIAAKEGIWFDPPTLIETRSADKVVAMLVVGHMGETRSDLQERDGAVGERLRRRDSEWRSEWSIGSRSEWRSEWSIGEAAPANCKNAYPYAMAEKRAKDRVIAKLVGLAAYVYSEAEADEFKDGAPVEPAHERSAALPQQRTRPASPAQAPTARAVPPVNPEEPPEAAEARRADLAHFWARADYGIDPAVIQGGLPAWDRELLVMARSAPNVDAYTKLKEDNRAFFVTWTGQAAKPVIENLNRKLGAIYRKLLDAEERAA